MAVILLRRRVFNFRFTHNRTETKESFSTRYLLTFVSLHPHLHNDNYASRVRGPQSLQVVTNSFSLVESGLGKNSLSYETPTLVIPIVELPARRQEAEAAYKLVAKIRLHGR